LVLLDGVYYYLKIIKNLLSGFNHAA